MEKKSANPYAEKDTKKSNRPSKDTSFLARLPKHLRENVSNAFFSDKENHLLTLAYAYTNAAAPNDGMHMKRLYAAKVEIAACIKQGGEEDNKIPTILEELPHLTAFATEARHQKLLQLFLQHVAQGAQDEAEKLLTDNQEIMQKLLTLSGTFTDYSGRTFNCTAYEYAYWADDRHMYQMLKRHMDQNTHAALSVKIKAISLRYEQHGQVVEHSRHFDMTPFITALKKYADRCSTWNSPMNSREIKTAWLEVGLAQRDLPVHVINEYCRPDRPFHPVPAFTENHLPRALPDVPPISGKLLAFDGIHKVEELNNKTALPTSIFSASSGLGVNFALFRGNEQQNVRALKWDDDFSMYTKIRRMGGWMEAAQDLKAICRLDEVRTADRVRSRENLLPVTPEHDRSLRF